jgi:protein-S-isoprenylcysteine O-methyltransferase Ste14
MMPYVLLVVLWIAWCAMHSALISLSVTEPLRRKFPRAFRYYRIIYNLFAAATLLPVLIYTLWLQDTPFFEWAGPWRIIQIALAGSALFLFAAGARRYDFLQFLGLRQIKDEKSCSVLTDDCSLDTTGILSAVRHPWYTGGILIVWVRPLDTAAVLTNLVITGYFAVGAWLEERKLLVQFGEAYADYRREVSMFLPVKWIQNQIAPARRE